MSGSASAGRKATARCLAAVVASVLAIMLAPAVASAKPPTAGGGPGGATVPWGFNEDWGWSNGAFGGSQMANLHMQKAGAIMPDSLSANRFHVEWAYVEGVRGTYNWSMSDAQYAAMQKYTKKPIMLLYRAPVWARDPARTCAQGSEEQCIYPPLPQYDNDWKAFVKAAVIRYPNVRAIEVWNEPNIATFWSPAADPTRYSAILSAAHDAVRAAGSKAPVLTGGLYPANTTGGNVSAKDFLDGGLRDRRSRRLRGHRLASLSPPGRLRGQDADAARCTEGSPRFARRCGHPPLDHRGGDLIIRPNLRGGWAGPTGNISSPSSITPSRAATFALSSSIGCMTSAPTTGVSTGC